MGQIKGAEIMSWYKIEKYIKIGALSHELKAIEEEHDKQIIAEVIEEFEEKALIEFTKFDLEHGYPSIADVKIIIGDIAEQLKEQKNDSRRNNQANI